MSIKPWRLIAILLPSVVAIVVGVYGWHMVFGASPREDAPFVTFEITPGQSGRSIAHALWTEGFISSERIFSWYARLSGDASLFQAGYFSLQKGMSLAAITGTLKSAEEREVQVTLPEGYTRAQMGMNISEVFKGITKEAWDRETGKGNPYASALGLSTEDTLEGYLFPDTYRFHADVDVETVVQTLTKTAEDRFEEVGLPEGDGTLHGLDRRELIILASIVEREVQTEDDMKNVAGLFYNRLAIGMPLQADSTVNYVTGGTSPGISFEETRLDSPYNTYKHKGLPPGPISNPGRAALAAVVSPNEHDWLYFLSTPLGETIYAKSFSEHVANKQKYLR